MTTTANDPVLLTSGYVVDIRQEGELYVATGYRDSGMLTARPPDPYIAAVQPAQLGGGASATAGRFSRKAPHG